jgi:hypothetical protein
MGGPLSPDEADKPLELANAHGQRALSRPAIDRLYDLVQRYAKANPGDTDAVAWDEIAERLRQSLLRELPALEPSPPPIGAFPTSLLPTVTESRGQPGWMRRHPVWTTVIVVFVSMLGLSACGGDADEQPTGSSRTDSDAGESLLVLDGDMEALFGMDDGSGGGDEVFTNLPALDQVKAANVTRFVMNLRGTDAGGPFVITFALPLAALDPNKSEYADITDEEALDIFKVQGRR